MGGLVEEKGGLSYPTSCVNVIFIDKLSKLFLLMDFNTFELNLCKVHDFQHGALDMHPRESKLEKEFIKWHVNSCVRFHVGKGYYEKACESCWGGGARYACK